VTLRTLVERARREWPLDDADPGADVRAWRDGAGLYEDGDDDELFDAGELIARAVRHHVHGEPVLRDDDLAVAVQSLLFAASTPSTTMTDDSAVPADAARLARLALAVILERGWQPAHLGGAGHLPVEVFADADIQALLAAALGEPIERLVASPPG